MPTIFPAPAARRRFALTLAATAAAVVASGFALPAVAQAYPD